ncbi:MAG: hypothetical protein GY785_10550 [Gammaproteobacteria bacterium]|nr:hypothetical protein [Gammaproteobacteria bacterium]
MRVTQLTTGGHLVEPDNFASAKIDERGKTDFATGRQAYARERREKRQGYSASGRNVFPVIGEKRIFRVILFTNPGDARPQRAVEYTFFRGQFELAVMMRQDGGANRGIQFLIADLQVG